MKKGFTITEMMVSVFIIGILAAIIGTATSSYSKRAKTMKCMANFRALGVAMHVYASDHRDQTPDLTKQPVTDLRLELAELDPKLKDITCPAIPKERVAKLPPYVYLKTDGFDLSLAGPETVVAQDVVLGHSGPKGQGGIELHADNHCEYYTWNKSR